MFRHMNDFNFERPTPLMAITFASERVFDMPAMSLVRLFTQSYYSNKANGITGILLFDGDQYGEIIEGEIDTIKKIWQIIKKDKRHKNINIIAKDIITSRAYATWSMRSVDGDSIASGCPELTSSIGEMSADSNSKELIKILHRTAHAAHIFPAHEISTYNVQ